MKLKLIFGLLMIFCTQAYAQRDTIPMEAYSKAISYTSQNLRKRVFHLQTPINWKEDSTGLWFVKFDANGKAYHQLNFDGLSKLPLFDHDFLTRELNKALATSYKKTELPLSAIEVKGSKINLTAGGKDFVWDEALKELKPREKKPDDEASEFESTSPDGKTIAFSRDNNLYIKDKSTGLETALSKDGNESFSYGSWYGWFDEMFGENGERAPHFAVQWSPDSKYLVSQVCDTRTAQKMYMLNHSIDSLYRAQLVSYYRGSPGDTSMVLIKPLLYDVVAKKEIKTSLPTLTHINSVDIYFTDDSKSIIASWLTRGFKSYQIVRIELPISKVTTLWEEKTESSIDHSSQRYVPEWNKILLESEKSGWLQLYILDIKTGRHEVLTQGRFVINSIEYIDKTNGWVYVMASGKEYGENPYHQKLYKVKSGGPMILLTPESGNHQVTFDLKGEYFVDAMSTINTETVTVLKRVSDGSTAKIITEADVSTVESEGWQAPMTFDCLAKDGQTTIYGAVWKPTNFDPNKKYPVLDATYTGPHTQLFPRSFDQAFRNQTWAELGFVVIVVDGLGTTGRSKAFREFSYQNMGDNLRDHVIAIKALGDQYSWVDTTRVGIFGHSAGGYDTGHALLAFPDFYKVGVASAGDHDFRMEKAWWPEMYMGWPVTEKYEEVSNIKMAPNLKGKLMIVHGGMDHNVNSSATFKLAEALVNANKDFDLVILPSQRHGFQGKAAEFFQKKRWNYFIEHLLGLEPRWDYKISE